MRQSSSSETIVKETRRYYGPEIDLLQNDYFLLFSDLEDSRVRIV